MTGAIITADRPEQLNDCISSYLTDRALPAGLLIMDDSRNGANRTAAQEAAARAECRFRLPVRFAGRFERESYVTHLSREGIPDAVARFSLLGLEGDWFTAGGSRNAVLLDSPGEKVVMLDDDTRGMTAVREDWSPDVRLGGHEDPFELHFFSSRDEAIDAVEWKAMDFFVEAERFLGMRLDQVAPGSADGCHHLRAQVKNASGVIRVTTCGVVGDSGYFSPVHLLWRAPAATMKELRESDSALAMALSSREVVKLVRTPTITHGAVRMATTIGLDNRRLLPPFLPAGRNEDGFFGNLLLRCCPEACTANLPFAVLHQAPGQRQYQRLANDAQTVRIAELAILLLSACPLTPGCTPDEALRVLGGFLAEMTRSDRQFILYAREIVRAARRALLNQIEDRWSESEEFSKLYKKEIRQFRFRIQELVSSPNCWQPVELRGMQPDFVAGETRRFVCLTGDLLANWASLVDAARHLRTKNIRISQPASVWK
jgi:hypothetical protein